MAVTSLILLPMLTATLTTTSMTAMVAFLVTSSAATDYCSITPKHTMCRPAGVAAECSQFTDRDDPHFTPL